MTMESTIDPPAAPQAVDPDVVPVAKGPRMPRHEVWVELPQDAYPGFSVRLWVNYPKSLQRDLTSNDQDRVTEALSKIVQEHNNWLDEEGELLPPANTGAFWDAIPDELAFAIATRIGIEVRGLATAMAAQAATPRGRG